MSKTNHSAITITIPDSKLLRCVQPLPPKGQPAPKGHFITVVCSDGSGLLPYGLLTRSVSYGPDRLYKADLTLLANAGHDQQALAVCGFTGPWGVTFHDNNEAMFKMWNSGKQAGFSGALDRQLSTSADQEAENMVRRTLILAQGAGIRDLFQIGSADLNSSKGRFLALQQIVTKAQNPQVRQRLIGIGVGEDALGRMGVLADQLHNGQGTRATALADKRAHTPLDAAKAMLLGDVLMVSKAARSELPPDRARLYQVGHLLGSTRAKKGATQPAPQQGTPQPAGQGHGSAHGGHKGQGTGTPAGMHGTGSQGSGAQGTTAGAVTAGGTGAAGTGVAGAGAQGGGTSSATGTSATGTLAMGAGQGTGTAQGQVQGQVQQPAGPLTPPLMHMSPGMILCTMPAVGGPQLAAVVQGDGSVAWTPLTTVAPPQPGPQAQTPPADHHGGRRGHHRTKGNASSHKGRHHRG